MTAIDVAKAAASAGFASNALDLNTAVAVALAYSGGDPNKTHGAWGLASNTGGDLQSQANQAYTAFKADGWGPFPSHNNGSWYLYVAVAGAAITSAAVVVGGAATVDGASTVVNSGVDLALQVAKEPLRVLQWLEEPATWTRILVLTAGGLLLAAGLWGLLQINVVKPLAEPVAKAIGVVSPTGKVAKVASAASAAKGTPQ